MRRRWGRPEEYESSNAAWRKDYSAPVRTWTNAEGKSWNSTALNEHDYSRSCGYEWRWEQVSSHQYPELMSYPHLDVAAVDESKEYMLKLERQNKPGVELLEPFSLRCTFCVLLHGKPGSTMPLCGRAEKQTAGPHLCPQKGSRPPEDIAIRIAQAVACLHSQWYGKAPCVLPGAVVKYAQEWEFIAPWLDCHGQGNVLEGDLERLYMRLWDFDLLFPCSFVRDDCVLPWRAQRAAEAAFVKQLVDLKHELEERMLQAWEPEGMQLEKEKGMNMARVRSPSHLTHDFTQQLLEKYGFTSPFFSMVSLGKLPRLTIGATEDCKCQVPWNKRSRWERFPHVDYELPVGISPWQSLGHGTEIHWIAKGLDGDCVLQDELVALEPCISDDDLFSYCMALQTVLSGGREQFALTTSFAAASAREQSQSNLDHLPVRPDAFIDLAKERPNYVDEAISFEAFCAERLCAADSHPAEADARAQSPELLRWNSDSSSDTSQDESEVLGSETSNPEEVGDILGLEEQIHDVSAEDRHALRSDGGDDDAEESHSERDGEDDGVDWSGGYATPPCKQRKEFETPDKVDSWVGSGDYTPASDDSSDSEGQQHVKNWFHNEQYCNESECY